jgi:leucyl-tRNA synthetase
MPNWAGSSWYYLRYADPKNDKELGSKTKLSKWLPVDWYNGGMEHTTLHVLYSRFWHKFLYDIKVVPTPEPYTKRTSHGMILGEGGVKMSKSLGNVINPDGIVKTYGADTLRIYEMFIGPFDQHVAWSTESIIGSRRFIERVWKLQSKVDAGDKTLNNSLSVTVQKTIKKVGDDIEKMQFNTAISSMMILVNEMDKAPVISKESYMSLIQLLAPFAPHVTEELWSIFKAKGSIHEWSWPVADESVLSNQTTTLVVQVMGKVRATIPVDSNVIESDIVAEAKAHPDVVKWIEGKEIIKVIYIPGKIVNIVVKG